MTHTIATWTNGRRTVTGRWQFVWSANRFVITLDEKDRITGEPRRIVVSGDVPEWGEWRRISSV